MFPAVSADLALMSYPGRLPGTGHQLWIQRACHASDGSSSASQSQSQDRSECVLVGQRGASVHTVGPSSLHICEAEQQAPEALSPALGTAVGEDPTWMRN